MSDLLNSIKSTILGTRSNQIDKQIDSAFKSIEKYSISSNRNKYLETIQNLISSVGTGFPDEVLKNMQGTSQVQNYDTSGRVYRYNEYDAIVKKISYCQRALETLTDNIISPDDITKRSVQYVTDNPEQQSDDIKTTIARCKSIEKKMRLDERIKNIVRTTLKKGDNFIEILVSPKGQNALTILQEDHEIEFKNKINHLDPIEKEIPVTIINENNHPEEDIIHARVLIEYTTFGGVFSGLPVDNTSLDNKVSYQKMDPENLRSKDSHKSDASSPPGKNDDDDRFKSKYDGTEEPKKDKDNRIQLRDVFITVHDPKYIIRLETERFRSCLGYLVFPKIDPSTMQSSSMFSSGGRNVDGLCQDILNHLYRKLKSDNDKIKLNDDMKKVILNYLNSIQKGDDLKIRYVPPELMIHWRINPEAFDPYGESIFECVNYDCRLLMALKTAKTIKQLTFATDKRVISVETGLPRDAKNLIESLKEGISKRKYSIDSMGSINSIPSQIPTFETIYLPMRDGKKFIEIENQQWGMNPQEDVEHLKFIRDNIVANLGVPAPYLGLEENLCFSLNTKIPLLEGHNIELGKLIEEYEKDPESFNQWTYSIDPETHNVVAGKITKAIRTRKNAEMVRVYLNNGKFEECTPDHQWMMRDGSYKQAKDLVEGDSLMSWNYDELKKEVFQDHRFNHSVSSVEFLTERHDCGDLEIENYHNFALSSGVFVHNSNRSLLTVENINFCRTIISLQKELSIPLKEMFCKIIDIIFPESSEHMDEIQITFPEPKISPYEHQMEYVEQMQRLIEALKQLGISENWLKRKYLPNINWDEVSQVSTEDKLDKELGETPSDQEQMAMGGGFY